MAKFIALRPVVLVTSLFFLWGLAHNLNPILIPHLKRACQLNDFQSAFIDSAFYFGYFVIALPAGFVIKKSGYKTAILLGLLLFSAGAFLFYPAASARNFYLFLLALFIIASGVTFLETAANPYITILDNPQYPVQRLNLAQAFNGLAATIAPLIGGAFILGGSAGTLHSSPAPSPEQINAVLQHEAEAVQVPYLVIGIVVLLLALLVYKTHFPEYPSEEGNSEKKDKSKSIFLQGNLVHGVVAQFLYVGAKVSVVSFFIRFLVATTGISQRSAAYLLSLALLGFMAGRFIGSFIMKWIAPARLLLLYSVIVIALLGVAILFGGRTAIIALVSVEFFMSIMFPTIFAMSLQGLGQQAKLGSSFLIMSIVGGAIIPPVMGYVSDRSNIQLAYTVPLVCFAGVLTFAWRMYRQEQWRLKMPLV